MMQTPLLAMAMDENYLTAAITSMAGVIIFLWRHFEVKQKAHSELLTERWQRCEAQHEDTRREREITRTELLEVTGRVKYLEGFTQGTRAFSEKVLEAVEGKAAVDKLKAEETTQLTEEIT